VLGQQTSGDAFTLSMNELQHSRITVAPHASAFCTILVFTARRYASAVYAAIVCPSVRLSHAGVL